jgi:hypothetical protein
VASSTAPFVAFLIVVGGNFNCEASGGHGVKPRFARRAQRWASGVTVGATEGLGVVWA